MLVAVVELPDSIASEQASPSESKSTWFSLPSLSVSTAQAALGNPEEI